MHLEYKHYEIDEVTEYSVEPNCITYMHADFYDSRTGMTVRAMCPVEHVIISPHCTAHELDEYKRQIDEMLGVDLADIEEHDEEDDPSALCFLTLKER